MHVFEWVPPMHMNGIIVTNILDGGWRSHKGLLDDDINVFF